MLNPKSPLYSGDSYKYGQYLQYPPGMNFLSSYVEARSDLYGRGIVMAGLQWTLREYTQKFTHADVRQAAAFHAAMGQKFNEAGYMAVVDKFDGYLPIKVDAVPEGTIMPHLNACIQVTNTHKGFGWLVSPMETHYCRALFLVNGVRVDFIIQSVIQLRP